MFPTEHKCYKWLENLLWENGEPVCSRCRTTDKVYKSAKKPHQYKCGHCFRRFNVLAGTVMYRTNLPIRDWIFAMYAMVSPRKGTSALQLSEELGISYPAAWRMLHRLRHCCSPPDRKLRGEIEADVHFSGGKQKNKHANKKMKGAQGGKGKECIHGAMERATGEVRFLHIPDESRKHIFPHIYDNVELGSVIYTDEASVYKGIERDFRRRSVKHRAGEYADGDAHINGIESCWAIVNRTISGTYYHVSRKHLPLYLREIEFRFNQGSCRANTIDRMKALARGLRGPRSGHFPGSKNISEFPRNLEFFGKNATMGA